MLDVDNLSVGVAGVPVLREVSFEIAPGEAVGLVGESGAGKSMTARAVARLLSPAAQIDGSEVSRRRRVRDVRTAVA